MNLQTEKPYFSFIIPNYNGEYFIANCLSSLLHSAAKTGLAFEGIVVDDCSTDKSIEIIKTKFPRIRLLINEKNSGFALTVNKGVMEARGEIIVLVNNDIVADAEFFPEIIKPFLTVSAAQKNKKQNSDVIFGVSAKTVSWDGKEPNHLNMTAHFEHGEIVLDYEDSKEIKHTLFVQAGAAAYSRELFIKLGCFADVFHPGYWEDYDISYLAAKCGYLNLYNPDAVAYHYGKGSLMKTLGRETLHLTVERNKYIFTWLNLTDKEMVLKHFLMLPYNIAKAVFMDSSYFKLKAFRGALKNFFRVLKIRRQRRSRLKFIKSDFRIFS